MEHHVHEPRDVRTDTHTPAAHSTEHTAQPGGRADRGLAAPRPRTAEEADEPAGADRFQARWRRIQSDFVDDPRASVAAADGLVGEAIEQLTARLNERRRRIESSWQRRSEGGGDTERLRVALREYRSLLDQLTMTPL